MKPIKNFINFAKNVVIRTKGTIISLHERLKKVDMEEVQGEASDPYGMLFSWLLDIFVYGSTATIVMLYLKFRNPWLLIPSIGIARWWILDFVKGVSKNMRGNQD